MQRGRMGWHLTGECRPRGPWPSRLHLGPTARQTDLDLARRNGSGLRWAPDGLQKRRKTDCNDLLCELAYARQARKGLQLGSGSTAL